MSNVKIIGVMLMVYLVALFVTFPANQAYSFIANKLPPNTKLYGIEGSIWSGHAAVVDVNGLRLSNVNWDVHFLPLLIGRMQLGINSKLGDGNIKGSVGMSLGGTLYTKGLQGKVNSKDLASKFQILRFAQGTIKANNFSISLDNSKIYTASGQLQLLNAAMTVPCEAEVGNLIVNVKNGAMEGMIKANIKDKGNQPIVFSGDFDLETQGTWKFKGRVMAKEKGSCLANMLGALGRPGSDGKTTINRSGKLPAKLF